jgi:hypothetical protein
MHDFDFLFGSWTVNHRRLRTRGSNADDWEETTGTAETRPLLGGLCNIEEHRIPGSDFSGIALRSFDKSDRRWAIHWVSERDGVLQPPVHGGFDDDEGLFEGEDSDGGTPVRVRFLWHRLRPGSAKWEQAFSYDEGRTWEMNWTMEFRRIEAT